jgi:hypothetical protein
VKNKTDARHTLHVKSSSIMVLVLIAHETVTTHTETTNFVSYILANRTEWQVRVDRRVEPNFLRQMVTPTKQHT